MTGPLPQPGILANPPSHYCLSCSTNTYRPTTKQVTNLHSITNHTTATIRRNDERKMTRLASFFRHQLKITTQEREPPAGLRVALPRNSREPLPIGLAKNEVLCLLFLKKLCYNGHAYTYIKFIEKTSSKFGSFIDSNSNRSCLVHEHTHLHNYRELLYFNAKNTGDKIVRT